MSETAHSYAVPEPRLAAARRGDEHEFAQLVEPYRRELQVHCYRILGSFHEAEDLLQETLLRAWQHLDTYQNRASFRAWLYKIATHACLDALDKRRARRRMPVQAVPPADPRGAVIPPLLEPVWLEPYPDEWLAHADTNPEAQYSAVESVSLSFLVALQTLPPRQRAILILRDVLNWTPEEMANLLNLTVSAVNSALHRARATMARQYHGKAPEDISARAPDDRTRQVLDRYVRAWQAADAAALVALLKEDAALSMPPSPSWYAGRASVGAFAEAVVFGQNAMFPDQPEGRWRLQPISANGRPAFAVYQRMPDNRYHAFGIHVIDIQGGLIAEIVTFADPSLLAGFGQPETLPDC